VRAGEQSRHAERFASANVIAVGWSNVEGLRDLTGLSRGQIHARLRATPANAAGADADTHELLAFRDELAVGDVVVTPDAPAREVLVGTIIGPYRYCDPSPVADYRHVRDVQWYGRLLRADLPDLMEQETRYRRTIRRLDDHHDEWLAVAERVYEECGGDVTRRRRSTPTKSPRSRIVRPHVPSPETRRCPGCGYQWPLAQFVRGSELCRDCRADAE
jgi:predicted Mrr-cat superfamily restriction endonuclease